MADKLISYDPAGVFIPEHGITPADIGRIAGDLDEARDEVLADAQIWADGVVPPAAKQPLDAGFHELPERLLTDFRTNGAKSEIGRIKATADRLAAKVDRAVVLGIGGSYMGARALLEACCHPYYNEIPRN
ncbi:MAG: hypothetical protein KDA44_20560, partial [Planctomycetales bacterium]|nr:hypothetical protein [Planctomycetales bacterium]